MITQLTTDVVRVQEAIVNNVTRSLATIELPLHPLTLFTLIVTLIFQNSVYCGEAHGFSVRLGLSCHKAFLQRVAISIALKMVATAAMTLVLGVVWLCGHTVVRALLLQIDFAGPLAVRSSVVFTVARGHCVLLLLIISANWAAFQYSAFASVQEHPLPMLCP